MKAEFIVSDMTCNHCVQTITKAVQTADPQAQIHIDLSTQRVSIETALAADILQAAIAEEGYDAQTA